MDPPSAGGIFTSVIQIGIGRRHRLSAYDPAYLELAARLGLPIATRDDRILGAAAAVGVTLLPLA